MKRAWTRRTAMAWDGCRSFIAGRTQRHPRPHLLHQKQFRKSYHNIEAAAPALDRKKNHHGCWLYIHSIEKGNCLVLRHSTLDINTHPCTHLYHFFISRMVDNTHIHTDDCHISSPSKPVASCHISSPTKPAASCHVSPAL